MLKKTLKTLVQKGFGNYKVDFIFGVKQIRTVNIYQSKNKLILTNTIDKNSVATKTLKDIFLSLNKNVDEIVGELTGNDESYATFTGVDMDHRRNTAIFTWLIDEEYPKEDQYLLDAS